MIQSMQNYQNKQQELTNLQQKKVEFESTLQIEAQEVLQKRMVYILYFQYFIGRHRWGKDGERWGWK